MLIAASSKKLHLRSDPGWSQVRALLLTTPRYTTDVSRPWHLQS